MNLRYETIDREKVIELANKILKVIPEGTSIAHLILASQMAILNMEKWKVKLPNGKVVMER